VPDGRLFVAKLGEPNSGAQHDVAAPPRESVLAYVYVRRDLVEAGASLAEIIGDINDKIDIHGGIILSTRQFLRTPLQNEWCFHEHFDEWSAVPIEHPICAWGEEQQRYFDQLWGMSQPFRYVEGDGYDEFAISTYVPTPLLEPEETVCALVETDGDDVPLECPCHWTQIVYTTKQRVLCLGCGQLLCVLTEALPGPFPNQLTSAAWLQAFDSDGELVDDDIQIDVIRYRLIEAAPKLWQTDVWDEVSSRIHFYATASQAEIEQFHRSCFASASALMQAGFCEQPTPPSLGDQMGLRDWELDLAQNAALSINLAAMAYAKGKNEPTALRDAVLSIFHATELLLKLRLANADEAAMEKSPNNPTVIKLLAAAGISFTADENVTLTSLRQLRNKLQHAGATISYRSTRSLIRKSFILLDRFTAEQLDVWIGSVCDHAGWLSLLAIDSIRERALEISHRTAAECRANGEPADRCLTCDQECLIDTAEGPLCLYCRDRPMPKRVFDEDDPSSSLDGKT